MLVVDLGGQYSQLIARRVRECRVYSELVGHAISPEAVRARNPYALVLSGGPASVYADGAPRVDPGIFRLGGRSLGVCYGLRRMALELAGAGDAAGAPPTPARRPGAGRTLRVVIAPAGSGTGRKSGRPPPRRSRRRGGRWAARTGTRRSRSRWRLRGP